MFQLFFPVWIVRCLTGSPPQGLGYAAQHVAPGPAQADYPDPWVEHVPAPDQLAAENLRRLANRFLRHPDTQIEAVRMEPGPAGRFKVMISLETADFI